MFMNSAYMEAFSEERQNTVVAELHLHQGPSGLSSNLSAANHANFYLISKVNGREVGRKFFGDVLWKRVVARGQNGALSPTLPA